MPDSTVDSNGGSPRAKVELPYVAFFWDIENCRVPLTKSGGQIVRFFREKFLQDRREADFIVVCDINKENPNVIKELNLENVTLVHVPCVSKNAADDKLKTLIGKYSDLHNPGDVIILISGDINFSPELQKARHERKLDVIIIHPENINPALLSPAKEHYVYTDLIADVPSVSAYTNALIPTGTNPLDLMVVVTGLPPHVPDTILRSHLSQLVSMTGGHLAYISRSEGKANFRFKSMDLARRGRAHLDGGDAFGHKLRAEFPEGSKLYQEQLALNGQTHRITVGPAFAPSYSSGQLAINGPVFFGMHHSASVPANLVAPQVRPPAPPTASRFQGGAKARATVPFASYEDRLYAGGFLPEPSASGLIRPPNGKAHMPGYGGGGSHAAAVPAALIVPGQPAVSKSSISVPGFFKRSLLEKAQLKLDKKSVMESPTDDLCDLLGKTSVKNGNGAFMSVDKKQQMQFFSGNSDQSRAASSVDSARLPDTSSKDEVTNIYFVNLNTDIDQSALYFELLTQLEALVPIEHLSMYADKGVLYAHVAVLQAGYAKVLIEHFHGLPWHNRALIVTMDDPSRETTLLTQETSSLPSIAVRRAIIRLFLTLKKDEIAFMELVSFFRREYDQILDLKMLRSVPDIVEVKDKAGVLVVALAPAALQFESDLVRQGCVETLPFGYCLKHCAGGATNTALLKKAYKPLGLYRVLLKDFSPRITQMLAKHGGSMPINSFMVCYDGHFEKLKEDPDNGSYLEHLLLSIPGVVIGRQPLSGPRMLEISAVPTAAADDSRQYGEDSTLDRVAFMRAVLDMLVRHPRSAVALSDFAAALHRHCGKLCDVRGYELSQLIRLLAVSQDVQVIGVGAERLVTLSHEAQCSRFAVESAKMRELCYTDVTEENVAACFQVAFEPITFEVRNYGVSYFQDLIEFPEETAVAVNGGRVAENVLPQEKLTIAEDVRAPEILKVQKPKAAVPVTAAKPVKTAATSDEQASMKSMQTLAKETVELLITVPDYREDFVRFPCTYHRLFGGQLAVRDYGFLRLVDLCEAMSDVIEVETVGKTRTVVLRREKRLGHLGQIIKRVALQGQPEISLTAFQKEFQKLTGFEFKRENYGAATDVELFLQFGNLAELVVVNRKLTLRFKNVEAPRQATSTPKGKAALLPDRSASPESPPIRSGIPVKQEIQVFSGGKNVENKNGDSGISADEQDERRPSTFVSQRLAMSFGF